MKTGKITEQEQRLVLAATKDPKLWIKVDEAAKLLELDRESILNNCRDHKYPELIVRQSLLSKVWWIWLPAVLGFSPEEWAA
jgi:hypothetical protein